MRNRIAVAAFVLTCFALAPAKAQIVQGTIGAGPSTITVEEARDIAVANGVVSIRKIELDEGLWKIYGDDPAGRRVEMKIDPHSGVIAQLNRFY